MDGNLNIIIASDSGYLCHATITIMSILRNTDSENIMFYFLDEGIGQENKEYLHQVVTNLKGNIEFIAIDKEIFSKFHVSGHVKQSTYYRIIAPDLLPANIDRAIYVDSDLIVNADLNELFNSNIGDFTIAAVEESEQDLERISGLGIKNLRYFNAGVLLMNLAKWRKDEITKKAFQYILNNPDKLLYWDQDALNAVFEGEWFQLDAKWNVQTKFFGLEKYKEVCLKPAIIHFTADVKPWHIYSTHPFKRLYLEYREKTQWRNAPLINKELLKKLQLGSKLILFGTGSHAERILDNLPFEVAYFVDNNELKHGTVFLNKMVSHPDSLLKEVRDEITILIASMYTKEIGSQLIKNDFQKNVHFFELHS